MQSSNSIFIVQPAPGNRLAAVAKCEATLEAIPQTGSCIPLLRASLTTYSDPETPKCSTLGGPRDRQSILADTPTSPHEFSLAWERLCAFEIDGQAYCPAPSVLWKVWSSIFSTCTIHGWSLDQPLNVVFLARAVADDEIPPPILYAVIDRVRAIDGVADQDCTQAPPSPEALCN